MSTPQLNKPKKKPGHRNHRPLATHITVEEEEAREKRMHVVRDRDWHKVWGANLSWSKANKLAQGIAGRMKSDNVRVEEMPTEPDLLALCTDAEVVGVPLPPTVQPPSPEVLARQRALAAEAEAKRASANANKALLEARKRAQLAVEAAAKATADAKAQQEAADAISAGELFATPEDGAPDDAEIDPALLAESEALADASLEDILGD